MKNGDTKKEYAYAQSVYRTNCPKCGGFKRGWRSLDSETPCSYCEPDADKAGRGEAHDPR